MTSNVTVVDQRFQLIEQLGSGGMGTVWRAFDLALHREVALKEVRADTDSPTDASVHRERVLREARALARIRHPNVVAIHHIVDTPQQAHPWIVMELVRGHALSDVLSDGALPPGQVAELGRGILAALRAAHSVGVLHRDVKPANVLVREDGSPVLTDFGIAAVNDMTGLTATGSVVGSLSYVAPERLGGIEGNPASDLWSLGLVMFVAVEGYNPMRRDTSVETLAAVLRADIPPAQRAGPLAPVLRALLVADPAARPSADRLDAMLADAARAGSTAAMWAGGPSDYTRPPDTSAAATAGRRPPDPQPTAHRTPGPVEHRNFGGPGHPAGGQRPAGTYGYVPDRSSGSSRGPLIAIGAVVVGVVAAAAGVVALWPDSTAGTTDTAAVTSIDMPASIDSSAVAPTTSIDEIHDTTAPATPEINLVAGEGMDAAIAALEQASGTSQFGRTTVYPDFINTEAPLPDNPTLYDDYTYRNGVASRQGAGGMLNGPTVDLGAIDWSILPGLYATAEAELRIPAPKSRYFIVDPAWVFNDDKPTILVYLSDDYGGAYLSANLDGTIVSMLPRN